jgi:hypothetical protein
MTENKWGTNILVYADDVNLRGDNIYIPYRKTQTS